MAEGVAGRWFADPRSLHGCTHGALDKARIQMVPPFDALARIPPAPALGGQPLPAPFPGGIPIFLLQGMGQFHGAPPCREIGLVLVMHLLHVPFQRIHQA